MTAKGWRKRQISDLQDKDNNMKLKVLFPASGIGVTLYLCFLVLFIGGWILNVIQIANSNFDSITGMLVLRVAGIFLAPLGAILGWV